MALELFRKRKLIFLSYCARFFVLPLLWLISPDSATQLALHINNLAKRIRWWGTAPGICLAIKGNSLSLFSPLQRLIWRVLR